MSNEITIIKKYQNRRLYNTKASSYINLQDLVDMIKSREEFVVIDAKTNLDLTHATIVQIILDQETKGYSLLPTAFLKQVILLHNEKSSEVLQSFLEQFSGMFSNYHQNILEASKFQNLYGIENITQKNIELMEKFFKVFINTK